MSAPLGIATVFASLLPLLAAGGPAEQAPLAHEGEDVHQQMVDLIKKVEVDLKRIDTGLFRASTGRASAEPIEPAIPELLKKIQTEAHQAQSDMVRILELAKSHQHKAQAGAGA